MLPSHEHRWSEATLNAIATPVLIAGAEDRVVTFVNRAATRFIGRETVGSTVAQAFGLGSGWHMTDAEGQPISREDNPVARAARGEDVGPVELVWHGSDYTVSLVCYAEQVTASTDEPAAVVVSLFDVTKIRTLQEELDRAQRARDEFVHLAAHELRTPLTSLRLQVETARRKHTDLPGIVAVGHAVDRMARRVEQLLDVADMREHSTALHPERANLLEIVEAAARLVEKQARWAKSPVSIAPTLPIFGTWDRARLTQVVASLVSNAVKFGAGKPVEIVPRDEVDDASVSVIDHGIGVKPADRELIFERFHRRASSVHFGGLGLDLWITRELMYQMGGTIRVDETPHGGATVTIRVPKAAPPR